ncbi:Ribosomal proteins S24e, L23 and L15e [Glarea lozoyensis ATCC 20868]|uniref:Large ribosomal subunit protein uL23m n=2 Tax=Glarea lozoyensis TaxID=101852 RepID=S3DCS4_GLAL2|nr:Ribosomal proteins S24e, L23 and L15e [Glarea lozoyensis ATCC 20868]EHL00218.1 hypothetical protein M7I_3849 [Glarea lozoyensis 74030]EPE34879.1 Ribosomal proteins S24e, L23 and L15e [Glarea lozoyensis ATCC 20868]
MAARSAFGKGPKLGRKQVYLPNFEITLIRNPKLPPTFAAFIVPLNFNKLDLRDYLWNGYGVSVRGVRSFIQMQKVRQDKPNAKRPAPRRWFRPRSIKKMMVEMDKPFAWPQEPEDFSPWDKERYDAIKQMQEDSRETQKLDYVTKPTAERKSIAEQAKELLEGDEKWGPTDWEDVGEAQEVEKEVKIPEAVKE